MIPDSISVILPVYNDETNIEKNINMIHMKLSTIFRNFEIIVVDDGSTDDTFYQAVKCKDHARVIPMKKNAGKGAAFMTGYYVAQGDFILLMDADLQIRTDEVKTFFRIMNLYAADVVIGNKRHPYSNVSYTPARWVVSNTYNLICRILFGIPLRDTQCGFKLFKSDAIRDVLARLCVKRFAYDLELIVALRQNGVRIADAPIKVEAQYNRGSASWKNIWETLKDTLAVWFRQQIGHYKCDSQ